MKVLNFFATALVGLSLSPLAVAQQSEETTIAITAQNAGPTPFIAKLTLSVSNLAALQRVKFTITPKPGSVTRALSTTYSKGYLEGRGYVDANAQQIIVPIFGLYDNYTNEVGLTYFFADNTSSNAVTTITTAPFDDGCDFDNPVVRQPRTASTTLSYDFILVSSTCSKNSPTIIDTDGAVRWVGTANASVHPLEFYDNAIYLAQGPRMLRIELDGEVTVLANYRDLGITGSHHNVDKGKYGLIVDVTSESYYQSVNIEIDPAGNVLKTWVLGDIISAAMIEGGDDPAEFVRQRFQGVDPDWFHNNSVTYRKSDDSLILSSRENFVICLDYETGAIKWILGDTTKKWYQFPSLRKYALDLAPGSLPPIGQHTVSITHDDHLLLIDNGQNSQHATPQGVQRGYTASRKYRLDLDQNLATQVWQYPDDQSVFAPYCSSVYEDAPFNYLTAYANVRGQGRILGLSPSGEKVFEYGYPAFSCADTYRALPIHLENLIFPTPTDVRLANISARSEIRQGDNVGIAGFIISAAAPKTVIVRGLGPSLRAGDQPLAGRLMNPVLRLHNADGQLLLRNDDHKRAPNAAEIAQTGLAPTHDREAAIMMDLPPGAYTTVLHGIDQTTGIALVEVFDLAPTKDSSLVNLSSRAFSSTGDNVLIGGVILRGDNPRRLLFRAVGPQLTSQGVSDAVQDTLLDVHDRDGTKIASNDDWRQAPNASDIEATGVAPGDERESAILMSPHAGSYTCTARGKADTGTILLELYHLD